MAVPVVGPQVRCRDASRHDRLTTCTLPLRRRRVRDARPESLSLGALFHYQKAFQRVKCFSCRTSDPYVVLTHLLNPQTHARAGAATAKKDCGKIAFEMAQASENSTFSLIKSWKQRTNAIYHD